MKRAHPVRMKGGFELDAFTGWRRMYNWKPGILKWLKRHYWKRVRRQWKDSRERP